MKGEKRLREGYLSTWDDAWLSSLPHIRETATTIREPDSSLPRLRKAPDWYKY